MATGRGGGGPARGVGVGADGRDCADCDRRPDDVEDLAAALTDSSGPPGAGSDPGTTRGLRRALLVAGDAARRNGDLARALDGLADRIEGLEARCRRIRIGRVEAPVWLWLVTLAVATVLLLAGRAQDLVAILRAVGAG
jgi:hypothetical protein